jgi:ABC-type bacteriocin/lantibiotic exporter with double-glycine peptidase domain
MKKKIKYIPQHDSSDCGAAVLSSITHGLGEPLNIYDARRLLEIDQGGSSFVDMCEVLNRFFIQFDIFELENINDFKNQDCLMLCVVDKNLDATHSGLDHYNLVYKTTENEVFFIDPGIGKLKDNIDSYYHSIKKNILAINNNQNSKVKEEIRKEIKAKPAKLALNLLISNRLTVLSLTLFSILITILDLLPSIIIGKIVDSLAITNNVIALKYIVSLAGTYLILYFLRILNNIFRSNFSQKMDFTLGVQLLNKILSISFETYSNRSQGDYINRFSSVNAVENFLSAEVSNFLISILSLIIFSIYLFSQHYLFGILALILFVIMTISTFLSSNYFLARYFRMERIFTERFNLLTNLLYNLKELKTAGRVEHYFTQWEKLGKKVLDLSIDTSVKSSIVSNSNVFFANAMSALVLYQGYLYVSSSELTIGQFVTIFSIFRSFINPVSSVSEFITKLQNLKISEGRLNDILTEKSEVFEDNKIGELTSISLNNVTIKYKDKIIIKDLNLELRKGEILGLSGPSGCGKTTLIQSILGLKEITEGEILYNSKSINFYTKGTINQKIGYVSQYPKLFSGSLLFNLTLRNRIEDVDLKHLEYVCRILCVDEIINNSSQGYFKFISDTGEGLSGGQKQRIAIARALYPKIDFLLLDEPTSSLDQKLENSIINNLASLKNEIGIVFSSHRLSHFGLVDRCLYFNENSTFDLRITNK